MGENVTNNPKVLVVENDLAYQKLLEKAIQRAGGKCECLFDGESALEKVYHEHFDLLLVDLHLPKLDGIMLGKLLRERRCDTPLIAITALKLESLERNTLAVGFNDFLEKPITEVELSSLFEKYCHHKAAQHAS